MAAGGHAHERFGGRMRAHGVGPEFASSAGRPASIAATRLRAPGPIDPGARGSEARSDNCPIYWYTAVTPVRPDPSPLTTPDR